MGLSLLILEDSEDEMLMPKLPGVSETQLFFLALRTPACPPWSDGQSWAP